MGDWDPWVQQPPPAAPPMPAPKPFTPPPQQKVGSPAPAPAPAPFYGGGGDSAGDRTPPPVPGVGDTPTDWAMREIRGDWRSREPGSRGGGDSAGDQDTSLKDAEIERRTLAQFNAAETSRFKNEYPNAPTLEQIRDNVGKPVPPPDPKNLQFMPGVAPSQVFDVQSGNIYSLDTDGTYRFRGNITMPQVTELQRDSSVAMGRLTKRGVLAPAKPVPLPKGDYGWTSKTSSQVPGELNLWNIDVNNPTLEDISQNLSHASGTIWAPVDRTKKRAFGVGSVLAFAGTAGVGAIPGLGLWGIPAAAGAGGLGMFLGQTAGHGGDLSKIDWNEVVRSTLTSAAGGAVNFGAQAVAPFLGIPAGVPTSAFGRGAGQLASMGTSRVIPRAPTHINAYQPFPGMSPSNAQRNIGRLGF